MEEHLYIKHFKILFEISVLIIVLYLIYRVIRFRVLAYNSSG